MTGPVVMFRQSGGQVVEVVADLILPAPRSDMASLAGNPWPGGLFGDPPKPPPPPGPITRQQRRYLARKGPRA